MNILENYKTKHVSRLPQYIFNLLILVVFWGGMLRKSYNYDTLYHMIAEDADVMTRIRDGRYATALVDFVLLKLGLRTTSNISITILLTLIVFAVAMLMVQSLFARFMPDDKWARAGFYCGLDLAFLNVLFAELLMFGEFSIHFAFAYLAASLGIICFSKRKYLLMLLMYVIAVCFYQNSAVFAAVSVAFYICLDEKMVLSKRSFVREITAVSTCMAIGGIDLLSIRTLEWFNIIPPAAKVSGIGKMTEKLSMASQSFISLNKNAAGIMPNLWLPLLFTVIIWIVIIYSRINERNLSGIPFLVIVCLGSYALLYIIPLTTFEFYFPPRLSFCFFLVQGLLLASSYSLSERFLYKLLSTVGVLYLLIHFFFSGLVITDHFVSNAIDEVYVNMLYTEILKYENETGIEVKKLAVMKDIDSPPYYKQVSYVSGQINERVIDSGPVSIIRIVTGRSFEKIDMPKNIKEQYFKDKNWDYFDLEQQLVIEGDTAYWCIF